jgi:hypothetical protein
MATRAERRVGEMMKEQPKNKGTAGTGNANVTGGGTNPLPDERPTLAEVGIDKDPRAIIMCARLLATY